MNYCFPHFAYRRRPWYQSTQSFDTQVDQLKFYSFSFMNELIMRLWNIVYTEWKNNLALKKTCISTNLLFWWCCCCVSLVFELNIQRKMPFFGFLDINLSIHNFILRCFNKCMDFFIVLRNKCLLYTITYSLPLCCFCLIVFNSIFGCLLAMFTTWTNIFFLFLLYCCYWAAIIIIFAISRLLVFSFR